jgi:flagellin
MNITLSSALSTQSSNASMDLSRAQRANDDSNARLSSGSRLVHTSTDPAGYAVSLKLRHTSSVLGALESNLLNARSFLETQASGLSGIASALQRMDEIAILMKDPTRSTDDNSNYLAEANQLRAGIAGIQKTQFNDRNLFVKVDGTSDSLSFRTDSGGSLMSLTQSDFNTAIFWGLLLGDDPTYTGSAGQTDTAQGLVDFSNEGLFQSLQDIVATMMATNGAEQSRLNFAIDNLRTKATAFTEARSRISDVDVATEVTRLNRSSVLLQSGASMLTQANVSNELALKLLSA